MSEEKTFELVPVLDAETGKYTVKSFENVKKIVSDFVERETHRVIAIQDDLTLKEVKATRTDIRKKKEMISQARIHINSLLLGEFNSQLKEIETMLDTADKALKEKVDTYNEEVKGKENKPKVTTLIVKGYDVKAIEKVKAYAMKNGLTAEVK